MNENVDLFRSESEQPTSLDNFESLVHERRGVDGDLGAHVPGRMPHRFGNGCEFHVRFILRAKWSTRGREYDSSHFLATFTAQALVQSVVRGIDRQQLRA